MQLGGGCPRGHSNDKEGISRTSSVPCDREEGGLQSRPTSVPAFNLCLYQASSSGGGYNLARFGSPEPGLGIRLIQNLHLKGFYLDIEQLVFEK